MVKAQRTFRKKKRIRGLYTSNDRSGKIKIELKKKKLRLPKPLKITVKKEHEVKVEEKN